MPTLIFDYIRGEVIVTGAGEEPPWAGQWAAAFATSANGLPPEPGGRAEQVVLVANRLDDDMPLCGDA